MKWVWSTIDVGAAVMWAYYAVTVNQPLIIHLGLLSAALGSLAAGVREHTQSTVVRG